MKQFILLACMISISVWGSVADAASVNDAEIKMNNQSCGHAKAGRVVVLRNKLDNKSIKVTVETKAESAGPGYPKTSQSVHNLPAGGSKNLGCSRGKYTPYPNYKFKVLGVE